MRAPGRGQPLTAKRLHVRVRPSAAAGANGRHPPALPGVAHAPRPSPFSQTAKCNCQKLPEDYFIIQTDETVYCINDKREREIKAVIKHSKKEKQ